MVFGTLWQCFSVNKVQRDTKNSDSTRNSTQDSSSSSSSKDNDKKDTRSHRRHISDHRLHEQRRLRSIVFHGAQPLPIAFEPSPSHQATSNRFLALLFVGDLADRLRAHLPARTFLALRSCSNDVRIALLNQCENGMKFRWPMPCRTLAPRRLVVRCVCRFLPCDRPLDVVFGVEFDCMWTPGMPPKKCGMCRHKTPWSMASASTPWGRRYFIDVVLVMEHALVTTLRLNDGFSGVIAGRLPDSLIDLTLGVCFNQELGRMPLGLRSLLFNSKRYNAALTMFLPAGLRTLAFYNECILTSTIDHLPPCLEALHLPRTFNASLDGLLPETLRSLSLGTAFSRRIALPASLRRLTIASRRTAAIVGGLPAGLESLYCTAIIEDDEWFTRIPPNLTQLCPPDDFNGNLGESGVLPRCLAKLAFSPQSIYNNEVDPTLDNLVLLRLPSRWTRPAIESLPQCVQTLVMPSYYPHNVTAWPRALVRLVLPVCYPYKVSGLPDGIRVVYYSHDSKLPPHPKLEAPDGLCLRLTEFNSLRNSIKPFQKSVIVTVLAGNNKYAQGSTRRQRGRHLMASFDAPRLWYKNGYDATGANFASSGHILFDWNEPQYRWSTESTWRIDGLKPHEHEI